MKQLTSLPAFENATPTSLRNHKRMVDQEIALRFTAFWYLTPEGYSKDYTLDSFLLQAIRDIDDPTALDEHALVGITSTFVKGLDLAYEVFGGDAFRKWPTNTDHRNPFNRALFEAWNIELAKADAEAVANSKCNIRQAAREAMTIDSSYIGSVSSATGDSVSVQTRFGRTREIIAQAIEK